MHIPEGFISPQTFLPAAAFDAAVWWAAARGLKESLDETTLPFLAVAGAVLFVLSSLMIPIPGGTSIHLSGIGIACALFGLRRSILLLSLVLFVQALLFGQGGLSTFFTNTLAIAVVGPASAALMLRLLGANSRIGLFAAGFAGIFAAALATALLLGLQPLVASDASGAPLYFPFGFAVVLPAVLLPHLVVGALEGVITALAVPRLRARMQT
jgi:cobalt/nickel transport system permease protein